MRSKAPAMLVLLMLTLCPLIEGSAQEGRENQNGDRFVAISASSFSTSPLHIGDQNVTMSVTIRNLRSSDGNASNGDERLYNVTVAFRHVEDASGQQLQPPASPLVWDVQSVDNDDFGYTLGYTGEMDSSRTFSGFQFDVRVMGARPGLYNISFTISYITMISWSALETVWSEPLSENYDNVRFEVASNVAVGTPVAYADSMASMPLYSGAGFQLIGIPVRTLSGPLSNVTGTLSIPGASAFQPVISEGTSPDAMVGRITSTSTIYFRIDVPLTDPGIYGPSNSNITLVLRYIRETNWNSQTENIAAGEDGLQLTFTVDYTPLLDASGAPLQLVRGTEMLDVPVDLRNVGNADLVRLEVMLEADADFSPADYHYDGNGNRVPGSAQCNVESLKKGQNATAVFHLAVYPNAPAGIYRLELSYSGYFYNTGKTGTSSGYYPVTDALYRQMRGAFPHIDIEVVSAQAAVVLVSAPSASSNINPGGESEGVAIWLTVRNDEHFDLLDARITILAGPGTPVSDPSDGAAPTLRAVNLPRIAAGQQVYLAFEANLNTTLSPGLHMLTMVLNATGEDSGAALASQSAFFIRAGPFGPDIQIEAGPVARIEARTRDAVIPITIHNSGSAALSGVLVRLACGPGTPITDPSAAAATSMVRDIGALGPGGTSMVEFVADIDGAAEARTHILGVDVSGSYSAGGEPFALNGSIAVRVHPSPPALVVQNLATDPAEIIPGRAFTLSFAVKNVGGERANGVWAGMTGLAGTAAINISGGAGPTGLPGEVPFSADVAVKYIGDIEPGQQVNITFNMLSDVNAGRGRAYQQPLVLSYRGMDAGAQVQQFGLAVRTKAAAAPAAPPKDWTPTLLLLALIIIVVAVLVALAMPRRPARPPAEPHFEKDAPENPPGKQQQTQLAQQTPSQVAVAVPMQPPPPPPPGYSEALAQSQPLPPPPQAAATAMRVEGGATQPGRPGPLEGYAIPGADADQPRYSAPPQKTKAYSGKEVPMRNCPTCGNEVKVRFVKCPYCGSDLPPVT